MRMTKEIKQLAIHALKTLLAKVEKTSERDENYAVLRNTQRSAEALMETFLNDGSTEIPIAEESHINRAHYRILFSTTDFVLIEDVGPHDRFFTVTNDVERVVSDLIAHGKLQTGQRLFCLDSYKVMDEIAFEMVDGFQRFKLLDHNDSVAETCFRAWKALQKYVR